MKVLLNVCHLIIIYYSHNRAYFILCIVRNGIFQKELTSFLVYNSAFLFIFDVSISTTSFWKLRTSFATHFANNLTYCILKRAEKQRPFVIRLFIFFNLGCKSAMKLSPQPTPFLTFHIIELFMSRIYEVDIHFVDVLLFVILLLKEITFSVVIQI